MNINYKKVAEETNLSEEQVKQIEKETLKQIQLLMSSGFHKIFISDLGSFEPRPNQVVNAIRYLLKQFKQHKVNSQPLPENDVIKFRKLWEYRHKRMVKEITDKRRKKNRWI